MCSLRHSREGGNPVRIVSGYECPGFRLALRLAGMTTEESSSHAPIRQSTFANLQRTHPATFTPPGKARSRRSMIITYAARPSTKTTPMMRMVVKITKPYFPVTGS